MPVSVPKHPGCTFWELKQPFSIRVIWWVWGFAYMGYSERAGCSKCDCSAFAGAFMSSWPRATDIVSTKASGEHPCPRLGLVFGTRVLFKNFTLSRAFLHLHLAPSQLLSSSSQQVVLSHRADVSLWGSRAPAGERQHREQPDCLWFGLFTTGLCERKSLHLPSESYEIKLRIIMGLFHQLHFSCALKFSQLSYCFL